MLLDAHIIPVFYMYFILTKNNVDTELEYET